MALADHDEEKKPLLTPVDKAKGIAAPGGADAWAWTSAYSLASHVVVDQGLHGEHVVDYDPFKLSTFRVYTALKGTVFYDPALFVEQFILTVIFFFAATVVYIHFNKQVVLSDTHRSDDTMNEWLKEQEPLMRAFSMVLTSLAAFLLSFYTAIIVGRWWNMRTSGIGAMKAAAMELEMYIHQLVTKEQEILLAIRRYARASLALVFMWRRSELKELDECLSKYLPADEIKLLKSEGWNTNLHETIWAWQVAIVAQLHTEKKIDSEPLLAFLLQRCSDGRAGVQCIATLLSVRVPMQYVHLLGYIVKMHNFIVALLMGMLFGAAIRDGKTIICIQLFARTLLLPLVFNSILLINAGLSDPFKGGASDFPHGKLDTGFENDSKAFVFAGEHLPKWLAQREKESNV